MKSSGYVQGFYEQPGTNISGLKSLIMALRFRHSMRTKFLVVEHEEWGPRITLPEYGNTLHDLFGVNPMVAQELPDEVFGEGDLMPKWMGGGAESR